MNFFAHAYVARRASREPTFLLGAMLPDFATMCGARLGPSLHPELARGIAEHHATDEAFHAGETFLACCRDTAARLEARGLSWGSARAVAHVGTELFLDGELAADVAASADYLRAVEEGAHDRAGQHVVFRDPRAAPRFAELHARLTQYGTPTRYREPVFVEEVLVRILARRPRLAIEPGGRGALAGELEVLQARVVREGSALVGETLEALGR